MHCKNCHQIVEQRYCGHCGQPVALKKVDAHYIVHEINHVLHLEKGILYTIRELVLRPGRSIRSFLSEDRSRLVKPIIYIIVTSLAYTLITHLLHQEAQPPAAGGTASAIWGWVRGHYGYANILMGVLIACWLRLIFRKSGYNFFEILIMLCFVMGTGMLIFAVFAVAEGLTHAHLKTATSVVMLAYSVWAIGQFLGGRKWYNYLLALVAYMLGMETFSGLIWLSGYLVDLAVRH